jgi:hypothetical protein
MPRVIVPTLCLPSREAVAHLLPCFTKSILSAPKIVNSAVSSIKRNPQSRAFRTMCRLVVIPRSRVPLSDRSRNCNYSNFEPSDAAALFWKMERLSGRRSNAREASSQEAVTISSAATINSSHFATDRNRAANSLCAAAIIRSRVRFRALCCRAFLEDGPRPI